MALIFSEALLSFPIFSLFFFNHGHRVILLIKIQRSFPCDCEKICLLLKAILFLENVSNTSVEYLASESLFGPWYEYQFPSYSKVFFYKKRKLLLKISLTFNLICGKRKHTMKKSLKRLFKLFLWTIKHCNNQTKFVATEANKRTKKLCEDSRLRRYEDMQMIQEVNVLTKEYEILATSMRTDIERIDRIIGIYAFAAIGIIAFLLQNNSIDKFMINIDRQIELIGLVLIIPIINAILLIHAISSFQVILVKAGYATYVIGERLQNILGEEVLKFDKIFTIDKQAWLNERTTVGIYYCLLSTTISIFILYRFSYVLLFLNGVSIFFIWIASCFTVSLSISFLIRHRFINKHFSTIHKVPVIMPFILNYWFLTGSIFLIIFSFHCFFYKTS